MPHFKIGVIVNLPILCRFGNSYIICLTAIRFQFSSNSTINLAVSVGSWRCQYFAVLIFGVIVVIRIACKTNNCNAMVTLCILHSIDKGLRCIFHCLETSSATSAYQFIQVASVKNFIGTGRFITKNITVPIFEIILRCHMIFFRMYPIPFVVLITIPIPTTLILFIILCFNRTVVLSIKIVIIFVVNCVISPTTTRLLDFFIL